MIISFKYSPDNNNQIKRSYSESWLICSLKIQDFYEHLTIFICIFDQQKCMYQKHYSEDSTTHFFLRGVKKLYFLELQKIET